MFEFFEAYGPAILSAVVAAAGAVTSVCALIKMFKSENRINKSNAQMRKEVEVTQQGIVEAFKTAKITPDIKISVSKQVDKKLEDWSKKILAIIKENEELVTKLAVANTKILAYTAAYNKLSNSEKAQIDDLLKEITEADSTIEIDDAEVK